MFSPTNMKKLLVLTTVFLINMASIKEVRAEVFDTETEENYAGCQGSLLVVTKKGTEKRFIESQSPAIFIAKSLEVEGCGCFILYKKTKFRGTSELITHHMGNVTTSRDFVGFTVRSVEKIPCEAYQAYAQPAWVVVCIVVGLVILAAIIAIVTIRCYRKFNPVPTEDRMIP